MTHNKTGMFYIAHLSSNNGISLLEDNA